MFAYHVLPENSLIWDIFHTGDSSGRDIPGYSRDIPGCSGLA